MLNRFAAFRLHGSSSGIKHPDRALRRAERNAFAVGGNGKGRHVVGDSLRPDCRQRMALVARSQALEFGCHFGPLSFRR